MKILDPGHVYELDNLDDPDNEAPKNLLYFVKREGSDYPGNCSHHAGTNIQEVLRACIDRIKYLNKQIHCAENDLVLLCFREALYFLERRAAERHGRKLSTEIRTNIESLDTCKVCGHVECNQSHHGSM